ncbi:DUF3592 domain-containing protein [Litoribaculum gwangyangense]|uniref:DUF3592 domain-containing protein n=1 Tax=Litoribaculum gwangyangense TaxID=1130722 RepID=A0ABP9C5P0_9FLAO
MFQELTDYQTTGLIIMLIISPLLINTLYIWYLANQSKRWPKVEGTIQTVNIHGSEIQMDLEYSYQVQGETHKNKRIFFTNSKYYKKNRAIEFEKKYREGQQVNVFYNPNKHRMAVLEPGRKDGVISAIILLTLFFTLGYVAFFNPALITAFIN